MSLKGKVAVITGAASGIGLEIAHAYAREGAQGGAIIYIGSVHSKEASPLKVLLKDTVDGEFTSAADVARAAVFLAGFEGSALTGQSLIVSHGWCME